MPSSAITDYATLAAFKAYLRVPSADTQDDVQLALAVTAASRFIDTWTNRHFGLEDPATARTYTATRSWDGRRYGWEISTTDISAAAGVVVKTDDDDDGTFETTLTVGTDFRLEPVNAPDENEPYTRIVARPTKTFPAHPDGVEVTAKWGWATIPAAVQNATLILASFILKAGREAPLGVAGSPDLGNELRLTERLHSAAAQSLSGYRRLWVAA